MKTSLQAAESLPPDVVRASLWLERQEWKATARVDGPSVLEEEAMDAVMFLKSDMPLSLRPLIEEHRDRLIFLAHMTEVEENQYVRLSEATFLIGARLALFILESRSKALRAICDEPRPVDLLSDIGERLLQSDAGICLSEEFYQWGFKEHLPYWYETAPCSIRFYANNLLREMRHVDIRKD